ncbi:hypothetical protein GCM10023189_14560 [Nibrella saemangeumensis]|uniref:Glycosyl transferase family 1 domain-containing protein n=2 Tax=Nibrella saemangeumensis TaxID=1084526 RepID=A0ABP8MK18_9BACT
MGYYYNKSKTGIGRIVDYLLAGLLDSPEVQLSLAAPSHLAETMRYAQDAYPNKAVPFVNRSGDQFWAGVENGLLRPFGRSSLPTKAIRYLFYQSRKRLRAEQADFNGIELPNGTIYHAPFYAIPEAISRMPRVHKVQTVSDLIPIIHPEWFLSGEDSVKRAIGAIPPDGWVVTISEATKEDLCNYYPHIHPERVVPIHLAAAPSLFYPVNDASRKQAVRAKYKLGEGPYLLSLATLEPRKNIDHLIRCFSRLIEEKSIPGEVTLVLVGTKGWKFDKITSELSRNAAIQSRIVFTGFVPDEDLAPIYAGAVAFVYPSLYEGFGLPPLEAMQCGLPVITSNVSSLPEVVGDAAIQVAPTDQDTLCQAMLTLVQSDTRRQELAVRALEQARLFSWEKHTAQHIDLYKRISND